jgi:hypothetical protein
MYVWGMSLPLKIATAAHLLCASASLAQWTAISLHPPGATRSHVYAITPIRQGGDVWNAEGVFPTVWSGSSGSAMFLNSQGGIVWGGDGDHFVGEPSNAQATLWDAAQGTMVNLNPAGALHSRAYGIHGDQQVGYWQGNGAEPSHACYWNGTAGSMVDLHPGNTGFGEHSQANATDGVHQGGFYSITFGQQHAALWSGSAASLVDMNPAGAGSSSVTAMVPGTQGGWVTVGPTGRDHAFLWHGTAASAQDMNPPGAVYSEILGLSAGAQVGYCTFNTGGQAGIWFGAPGGFLSLSQFLPAGYSSAVATCITEDADFYYVGGYASNPQGLPEAFMWVGAVPAPSSAAPLLAIGLLAVRRRRRA